MSKRNYASINKGSYESLHKGNVIPVLNDGMLEGGWLTSVEAWLLLMLLLLMLLLLMLLLLVVVVVVAQEERLLEKTGIDPFIFISGMSVWNHVEGSLRRRRLLTGEFAVALQVFGKTIIIIGLEWSG